MWLFPWMSSATGNRLSANCVRFTKPKASRPKPSRFRPRLEALEDRWLPSTLTVLNTNDSGAGSLRAEIAAAQSGDTIVFDPSLAGYAISLTSGALTIDKSLTIDGGTGPWFSIFGNANVTSNSANVTFDNLSISDGGAFSNGYGGAINNIGSLTLNRCEFDSNIAIKRGGAIYNSGQMAINNCFFENNFATDGGAIENQGTMTVTGGNFQENVAGPVRLNGPVNSNGGAIDNQGTLTISGCSFGGDSAFYPGRKSAGGEIANFGTLTVTGCSIGLGVVGAEEGGAIANFGTAVVTGCSITGGANFGGAVFNSGSMTISSSTIDSSGASEGGGIFNSGTLTLSASTVTGNSASSAGGGIYNTGTVYVINGSTVTGNTAPAGADL
jgi:predicted outer membrane repeat protein